MGLNKEFTSRDVQRLRNIVTKKYGENTITQVGYQKEQITHNEGDIWEENGKNWTIKNGIKTNISKLKAFKDLVNVPILCPKCSNTMKDRLDVKFYGLFKHCFGCQLKFEQQLKLEGKFEEYEDSIIKNNAITYLKDTEEAFNDFINTNETFISENGDKEMWNGGMGKEQLSEIFQKQVEMFKANMKM
jgi:hypothetical protein